MQNAIASIATWKKGNCGCGHAEPESAVGERVDAALRWNEVFQIQKSEARKKKGIS